MRRRMLWECFRNSEKKRGRWSIYMIGYVLRLASYVLRILPRSWARYARRTTQYLVWQTQQQMIQLTTDRSPSNLGREVMDHASDTA